MAGCFGNSQEDRARERELHAHLNQDYADSKFEQDVETSVMFALTNQAEFDTLDDDYEIVDRSEVARSLRNLDMAIRQFNRIYNDSLEANGKGMTRYAVDDVFQTLNRIKKNLESAVRQEIENGN